MEGDLHNLGDFLLHEVLREVLQDSLGLEVLLAAEEDPLDILGDHKALEDRLRNVGIVVGWEVELPVEPLHTGDLDVLLGGSLEVGDQRDIDLAVSVPVEILEEEDTVQLQGRVEVLLAGSQIQSRRPGLPQEVGWRSAELQGRTLEALHLQEDQGMDWHGWEVPHYSPWSDPVTWSWGLELERHSYSGIQVCPVPLPHPLHPSCPYPQVQDWWVSWDRQVLPPSSPQAEAPDVYPVGLEELQVTEEWELQLVLSPLFPP